MAKTGPIIIIDDNVDDLEFYKKVFESLKVKNEILIFDDPIDALDYLKARIDPCFFILCDVKMPKMDGLELREEISKQNFLRYKTIPFLFFSSSDHMDDRRKIFDQSIQGYFKKPSEVRSVKALFRYIVSYWSESLPPPPLHTTNDLVFG